MCPFCFASLALTIGGTISMGGLTGLAVKSLRKSQACEKGAVSACVEFKKPN